MSTSMTVAERLELGKVARLKSRVGKSKVDAMAAQRLADVEAQLAKKYSSNHAAWMEITARAKKEVAEADARLAERCRELGILPEFRPGLSIGWYDRGENGDAKRRTELRRVAQTKIAAVVKEAYSKIDSGTAEVLIQLHSGLITSDEGHAFLNSMPSVEELVPELMLTTLEAMAPKLLLP